MEQEFSAKQARAKKRIEDLKGYYIHLTVYILVNLVITAHIVRILMGEGSTFWDALFHFGTFSVWFFWGIGLFFHTLRVFSRNPFFGKDWEERQIRKFMEEDERESQKYR